MESKKISRDLLLQALPFGLFIAGMVAVFKEQNMHQTQQWWQKETGGWTFWNSWRGWAALSASVLFILALRSSGI